MEKLIQEIRLLKQDLNRMKIKKKAIEKELANGNDWMLEESLNHLNNKINQTEESVRLKIQQKTIVYSKSGYKCIVTVDWLKNGKSVFCLGVENYKNKLFDVIFAQGSKEKLNKWLDEN